MMKKMHSVVVLKNNDNNGAMTVIAEVPHNEETKKKHPMTIVESV